MRKPTRARGARTRGRACALTRAALLTLFLLCPAFAAQGGHTLFGDLHVDGARDDGRKPIAFTVSLQTEDGIVTERQAVSDGGRYRFLNLPNGVYYLVVEAEGVELARVRAEVQSPYKNDFRQDIQLQLSAGPPGAARRRRRRRLLQAQARRPEALRTRRAGADGEEVRGGGRAVRAGRRGRPARLSGVDRAGHRAALSGRRRRGGARLPARRRHDAHVRARAPEPRAPARHA